MFLKFKATCSVGSHLFAFSMRWLDLQPLRLETTWYNPLAETGLAPHCTVTHLATGQKEHTLKRSMSHREGRESQDLRQCF